MPPRVKFTREAILQAAVDIVREAGTAALTARALGDRLSCSVAPIFSVFENMEKLNLAVVAEAKRLYTAYIDEGLKFDLPFKGAGLKYIEFARREPNLFKLLFMGDFKVELDDFMLLDDNNRKIRGALTATWGVDGQAAIALHKDILLYTHGIAVMCAMGSCNFTDEEISERLTFAFMAMLKEIKSK